MTPADTISQLHARFRERYAGKPFDPRRAIYVSPGLAGDTYEYLVLWEFYRSRMQMPYWRDSIRGAYLRVNSPASPDEIVPADVLRVASGEDEVQIPTKQGMERIDQEAGVFTGRDIEPSQNARIIFSCNDAYLEFHKHVPWKPHRTDGPDWRPLLQDWPQSFTAHGIDSGQILVREGYSHWHERYDRWNGVVDRGGFYAIEMDRTKFNYSILAQGLILKPLWPNNFLVAMVPLKDD